MDLETKSQKLTWALPSVKSQSDCWIRYRALLEKKKTRYLNSYESYVKSLIYIYNKTMNKYSAWWATRIRLIG